MDQPGRWSPACERHLQRVDDQRGAHVGGHRPADDLTRERVLDGGEVQPALAGPQVGDVSDPQHVRASGGTARSTRSVAGVIPGIRIVVFHRFRGLTPEIPAAFINRATRLRPTRIPCSMRSSAWILGAPVHASAVLVDLLDLLGQPRVAERPVRRRPALPVMKAGPADPEHAAHHGDGIVRLLRGDQRVRLAYRPSSSLAKKTAAFRKISRSIRNVAFSSRNRASSSRSSPDSPPGRSPREAFSSLSQLRNVTSEIPSDPSPTSAAADRRAGPDGSPHGGTPPDTAASFWAPEPHFPRLTTGSVQVSSKTGLWLVRDYVESGGRAAGGG